MTASRRRQRLVSIYGRDLGREAAVDLEALLASFRPRLARISGVRHDPGGNDALLITYGDSLLVPDSPPLAALSAFATRHLSGRVSGVHVLPFFPYSSDYGFSVTDYMRVRPDLGSWNDVTALRSRFKLMFDFVLNHVSAESRWFQGFLRGRAPYRDFFITLDPNTDLSMVTRPRTTPLLTRFETAGGPRWVWTTFSADQVDLDYRNPQVLLRMVEVMLTYVERGADLLRMDAVGYLWKEVGTSCIHLPQTHQVVKLFREVLDAVAPDVAIVTETNVPQRENVSYFGNGEDEAQMVYQFPLAPLVLDAFARGDAGRLSEWAGGRDTPSARTTFFNFLASHDGIGVVPARGILSDSDVENLASRVLAHGGQVSMKANPDGSQSPYELNTTFFDALSDPAGGEPWQIKLDRYICSQAIMLALAGVAGIYVHSLFGSHNDREGFTRSGWKRDLNHQRLDLLELEAQLAAAGTETAQVFARLARLLEIRRAQPAFHPDAPQRILRVGPAVFALERGPRQGQTLLALHNVTDSVQTPEAPELAAGATAGLADLISGRVLESTVQMAPYQVLWLAARIQC